MALDKVTLEKLAKAGLRVARPNPDGSHATIPLFVTKVAAGLPAMADDGSDNAIDLHSHCVPRPESSFLLWVSGTSMIGAGIHNGDLLVVDRSIPATDGKIVITALDGEVTVKRLRRKGQRVLLVPENQEYPTIAVRPDQSFTVWGVVAFVVHPV